MARHLIEEDLTEVIPAWIKVTKSHTDFQAAGLTNDIEIYSLPAGAKLHNLVIKHSAAFTGTGIATYTISVGIVGNLVKFAPAFDVLQAPGNTVFSSRSPESLENWGAVTSIRAAAESTGANLDQSSTGAVEFYLLISTPKSAS